MESYTVKTLSEYIGVIRELYGKYVESGSIIVFRGQTQEFHTSDGQIALVPLGLRRGTNVPSYSNDDVISLDNAIVSYLRAYLLEGSGEDTKHIFFNNFKGDFKDFINMGLNMGEFLSPVGRFLSIYTLTDLAPIFYLYRYHWYWLLVAIGQHYGLPTSMLDTTTNPQLGLWFARNKYECQDGKVGYQPWTERGYVYVLKTPSNPNYIIPLSTLFFDEATRPRQQQAIFLSEFYHIPPRDPSQITFAHRLIARIVIETGFKPYTSAEASIQQMFPCPNKDALYEYLLAKCPWVRLFRHCRSHETVEPPVIFPTGRVHFADSKYKLSFDPEWFTILLVGEDAQTSWEYLMSSMHAGSYLSMFNLFGKRGFNLLKVSVDEAKDLIEKSEAIYAIIFCDIGKALINSGYIESLCKFIQDHQKIVVPAYINLHESERQFSTKASQLSVDRSEAEASKVIRTVVATYELAYQLRQASSGSKMVNHFYKCLSEHWLIWKECG